MKLAIVILNWNGIDLLQKFLPSVIRFSEGHQIYVVDNASTDGSVRFIEEQYPDLSIIRHDKNLGYAGGYNMAISSIQEDLLCLLNSDVEVSENWAENILQEFIKDPLLGAAQPKILNVNKPNYFEYAGAGGGFIDQLGYPYCRGRIFNYLEKDEGQYNTMSAIDWASGAALFVKKQIFLESGGFDRNYFAHQEEVDLCWRIRRMGYKIKVVPKAVVHHLGGGTLNNLNPQKTYLNFRNSLFNIVKNDPRPYFPMILFLRLIMDGAAGIMFMVTGKLNHVPAIFRAHWSFYRQINFYLKERKRLQSLGLRSVKNKGVLSIVATYYILGIKKFSKL